jgi:hypothetical protein
MSDLMRDEHGFVMVTALALLLMLGMLGVSTVMKSSDDMEVTANQFRDLQALYAAEAGAEKAYATFWQSVKATNKPPDPLPAAEFDCGYYSVDYRVDSGGFTGTRTLTSGSYAGLYALVTDFDIYGHAKSDNTGVQNSVKIRVENALIPIFQFAVFYDDVLEFHPGPPMALTGRVHSNSDIWLDSDNQLSFDSYLTSAGSIYHGSNPASGRAEYNGQVRIKDGAGTYQDVENDDGTWLDHTDPAWFEESVARWNGNVRDVDHGVDALTLPLETSDEPISIIKDASGGNTDSYEHKATLKIMDGQALYKNGASWVDVTANLTASGVLSTGSFYDQRDERYYDVTEIDISKLNTSAYWPSNGIVYTMDTPGGGHGAATRLSNGSSLKGPLTVVSENPVYTKGNYNSVNKQPAAILTDAYTILSSAFDDSKSTQKPSYRDAANTTVNVSFITGNVPSAGGEASGGNHNFPRFLEDWTGRKITWKGSMVQMWHSEQGDGNWAQPGKFYYAPDRVWSFDTDLLDPNKLPPGTPMVNAVIKRGWANTGGPLPEMP